MFHLYQIVHNLFHMKTSRPKATGWAPAITKRAQRATTSAAPTSPTSGWRTAARRSPRSYSSSRTPCAPRSWKLSARRTHCAWGLCPGAVELPQSKAHRPSMSRDTPSCRKEGVPACTLQTLAHISSIRRSAGGGGY